jgi:hypothetical protein
MQMLAVAAILVLGGLQFLPATHFRLHQDRGRNWIPIDPSLHAAVLLPAAAVSSCLSRLRWPWPQPYYDLPIDFSTFHLHSPELQIMA